MGEQRWPCMPGFLDWKPLNLFIVNKLMIWTLFVVLSTPDTSQRHLGRPLHHFLLTSLTVTHCSPNTLSGLYAANQGSTHKLCALFSWFLLVCSPFPELLMELSGYWLSQIKSCLLIFPSLLDHLHFHRK